MCTASDAEYLGAQVRRQPANEGAVQVREAENPATPHACAALQQVHASAALVTVRRQFGVAKDAEFRHGRRDVPLKADVA